MNYGWLEPDTSTREYQRVVRHEFGHALGMIHEHQNPAAARQDPVGQAARSTPTTPSRAGPRRTSTHNIFDVYDADIDELHRVRPDVDHAVRRSPTR